MKPQKEKTLYSLAQIQSEISQAIKTGETNTKLISIVTERAPLTVAQRLIIYQEAYRIRMLESLSDDFPRVRAALKKKSLINLTAKISFRELVYEFIQSQPSRLHNLGEYSATFLDYLLSEAIKPPLLLSQKLAELLHECATQDWLETISFHARDLNKDEAVTTNEINAGHPFLIKKHPATQTLRTATKIFLASRGVNDTHVKEITENEFNLINFLEVSRNIEEVSSRAEYLGIDSLTAQTLFSTWIQAGVIYCERISNA
jgi:hypothetical protein